MNSILKVPNAETGITEETYLYLPGIPGGKGTTADLGVNHFTVPVDFGPDGTVMKARPIGTLSGYEAELLKVVVKELKGNVTKGVQFVTVS